MSSSANQRTCLSDLPDSETLHRKTPSKSKTFYLAVFMTEADMFSNKLFMRVADSPGGNLGRGIVLLAPPQERRGPMKYIVDDQIRHDRLLAAAQRLRGGIYLGDGAITPDHLTTD